MILERNRVGANDDLSKIKTISPKFNPATKLWDYDVVFIKE